MLKFTNLKKTWNKQKKLTSIIIVLTVVLQNLKLSIDAFERDRKEKEKIINDLKKEVKGKVDNSITDTDRKEQYSSQKCLLIHGIPENKKNKDVLALERFDNNIEIQITERDNDRLHRLWKPKSNDRKNALSNKRYLKDSGASITKSLTGFHMKKWSSAREAFEFRNVWIVDGWIFYSEISYQFPKMYYN